MKKLCFLSGFWMHWLNFPAFCGCFCNQLTLVAYSTHGNTVQNFHAFNKNVRNIILIPTWWRSAFVIEHAESVEAHVENAESVDFGTKLRNLPILTTNCGIYRFWYQSAGSDDLEPKMRNRIRKYGQFWKCGRSAFSKWKCGTANTKIRTNTDASSSKHSQTNQNADSPHFQNENADGPHLQKRKCGRSGQ